MADKKAIEDEIEEDRRKVEARTPITLPVSPGPCPLQGPPSGSPQCQHPASCNVAVSWQAPVPEAARSGVLTWPDSAPGRVLLLDAAARGVEGVSALATLNAPAVDWVQRAGRRAERGRAGFPPVAKGPARQARQGPAERRGGAQAQGPAHGARDLRRGAACHWVGKCIAASQAWPASREAGAAQVGQSHWLCRQRPTCGLATRDLPPRAT